MAHYCYYQAVFCFLVAFAQATQYGNNHVFVRRDPPQVEANFPRPNVNLLSPAFISTDSVPAAFTNGTVGPTSDATLESFIHGLAEQNEWMSFAPVDYSSEEGRTFPYVILSSSPGGGNTTSNGSSSKVRIWLQGAVHGNEPAGDQAILALLGKMDSNQTWTTSILDKADIMILPRYNPDGTAYFQRALATNYDPNRDHTKLARQQTRNIKKTFTSFAPHVVVDMHEYRALARYGGLYVPGADALYSAAKNLNINQEIRALSESLFAPAIGANLVAKGFRWEPYVTGPNSMDPNSSITYYEADSDAKIGRGAMGLTQAVTFLFEMRGIGIADQEFYRRVATGLNMLESTIQVAVDNAEQVIETIQGGIKSFISSDEPIVITDRSEMSTRNWTFIEYESGDLVQVPVEFYSTTPVIADLTRARPEAYIIPRAWADLAARLEVSGLEVERIPYKYRGLVEALTIESASLGNSSHEGTVLSTVTTSSTKIDVELPPGSFRVSTRQKNSALAFVALEPENIDSYVSFNIIPVKVGDVYPIYRVMA